jgi:hypothetical protein
VNCPPRYATPRTDRETLGSEAAAIAEQLGLPLMPHQRLVVDVGLELRPGTRIPAYGLVIVSWPRQCGKTLVALVIALQRALRWPGQPRIAYSAQTGSDARVKMLNDWLPLIRGSAVNAALASVSRASGREAFVFKPGSRLDVFTSSEAAGHGRIVDLGLIDEAFADADDRREAALLPSMATRPSSQLWVISTAGHESSLYLKRKIEQGREAVANGETTGTAYFEWSADEAAAIDDPQTWRSAIPAIGLTIGEDVVRHAKNTMAEGEFKRAYLNIWTTAIEQVIPAAVWDLVVGPDVSADREDGFVLAVDCNPQGTGATIAAGDRRGNVEVIEHRDSDSVGWVVDRVADLSRSHRRAPIVLDSRGPASAALLRDLEARKLRLVAYGATEMAQACSSFYQAVISEGIAVQEHPALDAAVAAAKRRKTGDLWVWGRRDTSCDVSSLVAVTLAFHRSQNPPPRPRFINMSAVEIPFSQRAGLEHLQ